ncbi:MAG: AI-2E family transporter [Oxalobacter sp.]|nr:MAG: AI-2E family transporter [Oxalobacter sp.]
MLNSFTTSQKQTVLWVGLWLLLMVFLVLLGPIMTPFIAGAILAYALNPPVERICAWRIGRFRLPRIVAVIIVMLLLILAITALILLVVPILQKEVPMLYDRIPGLLVKLNHAFEPLMQELDIHPNLDAAGVKKFVTEQFAAGRTWFWRSIIASARVGGSALLSWMITLILTPVVLFYLLLDWRHLLRVLTNAVPRRWMKKTLTMAKEIDELLAQYLRGQLLVMLTLAVYYSACLAIFGFDVALPVGILTGLLIFIPYVGFGIGLVLATIAGLLQFDGFQGLVYIAFIYGGGQVIEGFYLTPKLVGKRIGLHPLMVIFALFAFGKVFGFIGVLLALPSSAVLSVAFRHIRAHYYKSKFYTT